MLVKLTVFLSPLMDRILAPLRHLPAPGFAYLLSREGQF